MGVGEQNIVDILRLKAQIAVVRIRFHTFSLVHSTVQENLFSEIGSNQVFAARNLFSSA